MTITTLPPAPSRADAANADTFSEIAETFVAALPVFSTQVNNTLADVNAAASGALASSNFKGSWAALTGAMSIPASVLHEDTLWLLVTNTSDITADEPGVSSKWLNLANVSGYVSLIGNQTIAGDKTFTGNVTATLFTGDGSGLTNARGVPGTVFYFAGATAPAYSFPADGRAISRTTYSALFSAIGTTYGIGNGSTTFNIPDIRGEFIRAWDNSRGVDSGRSLGSNQAQDLASHTHNSGITLVDTNAFAYGSTAVSPTTSGSVTTGGSAGNLTSITSATGGTETRPRNIAMLACIYY